MSGSRAEEELRVGACISEVRCCFGVAVTQPFPCRTCESLNW